MFGDGGKGMGAMMSGVGVMITLLPESCWRSSRDSVGGTGTGRSLGWSSSSPWFPKSSSTTISNSSVLISYPLWLHCYTPLRLLLMPVVWYKISLSRYHPDSRCMSRLMTVRSKCLFHLSAFTGPSSKYLPCDSYMGWSNSDMAESGWWQVEISENQQ